MLKELLKEITIQLVVKVVVWWLAYLLPMIK